MFFLTNNDWLWLYFFIRDYMGYDIKWLCPKPPAKKRLALPEIQNTGEEFRIDHFPIDVVEKICENLPSYDIVSLKLACKDWNYFFKQQRFAKRTITDIRFEVWSKTVLYKVEKRVNFISNGVLYPQWSSWKTLTLGLSEVRSAVEIFRFDTVYVQIKTDKEIEHLDEDILEQIDVKKLIFSFRLKKNRQIGNLRRIIKTLARNPYIRIIKFVVEYNKNRPFSKSLKKFVLKTFAKTRIRREIKFYIDPAGFSSWIEA